MLYPGKRASKMSRLIVPTAVIAALVATAPAHAESCGVDGPPCISKSTPPLNKAAYWARYAVLPPVEFDKPYEGELQIFRVEAERIPYVCPKTSYPLTLGCAVRFNPDPDAPLGSCHIVLAPDDVINATNWTPEIVLRHEIGHCNGWTNEHKGARRLAADDVEKLLRGEKLRVTAERSASPERRTSQVVRDVTTLPLPRPQLRSSVRPGINEIDENDPPRCYFGSKEVPCPDHEREYRSDYSKAGEQPKKKYECGAAKIVPSDNDDDPVYKTAIAIAGVPKSGALLIFRVEHYVASGKVYVRNDQYRDQRYWAAQAGKTWSENWSGVSVKDPALTMIGTIRGDNDSRRIFYVERLFRNGTLMTVITSVCRPSAAQATPADPPVTCLKPDGTPESCELRSGSAPSCVGFVAAALTLSGCPQGGSPLGRQIDCLKPIPEPIPGSLFGNLFETLDLLIGCSWAKWVEMSPSNPVLAEFVIRPPVPKTVIRHDRGGSLREYIERWSNISAQGGQVEVLGRCVSACTLVTAYIPKDRIYFGHGCLRNILPISATG
jgi:hypothetical protein